MSLMGSLYIGSSGLQGQQNALNTTAHNMANSETHGYVRQQVHMGTRNYHTLKVNINGLSNQQTGLGTDFIAARQVRDQFLDQEYRRESGRSAFYEVSSDAIDETETLLGKLDETGFYQVINDFWASTQELVKSPADTVKQSVFVQTASLFLENAKLIDTGLASYQENLNMQVEQYVNEINQYAEGIDLLNKAIIQIESGGKERANDLRDQRNMILDKLGTLGSITYKEDLAGNMLVEFEEESLVSRNGANQMKLERDYKTNMYTPYWARNAKVTTNSKGEKEYDISSAKVFDMQEAISTDKDTDVGKLRAIMFARGDHKGTFVDLVDAEHYSDNISQSVIMNIQAEFDNLIHSVTTKLNSILADGSEKTPGGYLSNEDGTPIQLFERISGVDWDVAENYDPNMEETLFTIDNIRVNSDIIKNPGILGFVKENGEVDQKTVDRLKEAFEEEVYSLNPNTIQKCNFMDYYSDLVGQVAISGYAYDGNVKSQQNTVASIGNRREQVMGVSVEEEMANMIRFQNGYNASSRYINAVSEMLEHILSTLG